MQDYVSRAWSSTQYTLSLLEEMSPDGLGFGDALSVCCQTLKINAHRRRTEIGASEPSVWSDSRDDSWIPVLSRFKGSPWSSFCKSQVGQCSPARHPPRAEDYSVANLESAKKPIVRCAMHYRRPSLRHIDNSPEAFFSISCSLYSRILLICISPPKNFQIRSKQVLSQHALPTPGRKIRPLQVTWHCARRYPRNNDPPPAQRPGLRPLCSNALLRRLRPRSPRVLREHHAREESTAQHRQVNRPQLVGKRLEAAHPQLPNLPVLFQRQDRLCPLHGRPRHHQAGEPGTSAPARCTEEAG